MGYEKETSPKRRIIGLCIAIAFHIALGLVLTSSLGRRFVQKAKHAVVVAIVQQQIKPPPPPPDLPEERVEKQKPRPKPKAFVPKVENIIEKAASDQAAVQNAISSVSEDAKDATKKPDAPPPPPPPPKVTSPVLLPGCPPPRYPQRSIDKNEQGLTVFRFLIGVDGSVQKAILVQSSGFDRLDSAAQAAFENCKFSPGRAGDTPTPAWVRQPFRWQIQ